MNIYNKIESYDLFSPTMKHIAQYVLEYPGETISLKASELAKYVYVSPASIVRFSKLLGYQGFEELKIALAFDLDEYLILKDWENQELYSNAPNVDINSVATYFYQLSQTALKNQYKYLDLCKIEAVANRIIEAKMIKIWGGGSSLLVAKDMSFRLRKLGIFSEVETMIGYDDSSLNLFRENEMNIIISESLQNTNINTWIDDFVKDKTDFYLITCNRESKFLKLAKEAIFYGDINHAQSLYESFFNRISLEYVIDVLLATVYTKRFTHSKRHTTNYKIKSLREKNRFKSTSNKK